MSGRGEKAYLLTCSPNEDLTKFNLRSLVRVFAVRMKNFASFAIQNAPSENSDQTARMRRLVWIFAGRTWPEVRFLTLQFESLSLLFTYNI